jgi:hypothetical protein
MYTGRPLPRPPKLINFLTSNKKNNDGPAALDKSNEGKRKRLRRSGSQQQQQALDIDSSGEVLSENDIEKARGFDLLNQAADSMSNRHHPQHDKILHHSRPQADSLASREKLQSSSSLEKDYTHTHASRWTEQAHSSTASSTEKMTISGSGIKGQVNPLYYPSTNTSSSDPRSLRPLTSWKQKRREELRDHHQHHVYNQGLWNMMLRMGQEVKSRMEKKK